MTRSNFYSGGGLDRAEILRRDPAWAILAIRTGRLRLVPVWRNQNLILNPDDPRPLFLDSLDQMERLLASGHEPFLLGHRNEVTFAALDLSQYDDPSSATVIEALGEANFEDLRRVGPLLDRWEGSLLAYARGLCWWHQRHGFCGVCGFPTQAENAGHQRRCVNPDCGAVHFPRTDPAVIMLVHDGDRCVLGRQHAWPAGMHSTLAGFVEPGESLEEAVAREVFEEVGLAVKDVVYHSSQPWPFPSSIMLGFFASTTQHDLKVDPNELESAAWFTREELSNSPEDDSLRLPRRDSIARHLVTSWLNHDF